MEKDADTIKDAITNFFKLLNDVVDANINDEEEIRRIYHQIRSDRISLTNCENDLSRHLTGLTYKRGLKQTITDRAAGKLQQ